MMPSCTSELQLLYWYLPPPTTTIPPTHVAAPLRSERARKKEGRTARQRSALACTKHHAPCSALACTMPMSLQMSVMRLWLQASAMSTRSPGFSALYARSPSANSGSLPLDWRWIMQILKVVKGASG